MLVKVISSLAITALLGLNPALIRQDFHMDLL
nr:winged-helix domain-containing protein [Aeromonas salmonicida]